MAQFWRNFLAPKARAKLVNRSKLGRPCYSITAHATQVLQQQATHGQESTFCAEFNGVSGEGVLVLYHGINGFIAAAVNKIGRRPLKIARSGALKGSQCGNLFNLMTKPHSTFGHIMV